MRPAPPCAGLKHPRRYTYDTSSYLLRLSDTLGRTWWDQPVYDHLDRVTSVRKGASHVTTRHYRPTDGLLDQIDTPTIQAMSFRYDGLGNLVNRSDTGVAESYGYDLLNRLEKRNNTTIAAYQPNGNLTSKTDVASQAVTINAYDAAAVANPADTTAVRNLPHAVAQYTFNAQTINLKYDLNGNLLTRQNATTGETWSMKWTGFDKPRWMARTETGTSGPLVRGSEFHYNARRSRVIQREFDSLSGTAPNQTPLHYNRKRLYALGSTLELNYTNQNTDKTSAAQNWQLDTVRIYVPGPDGIIGAREFEPARTAQQEKAIVYHYDHLGSIVATTLHRTGELATDDTGKPGKFSEDAWGQRRNPYTWSGPPQTSGPNASDDGGADSVTPRGYTGHEMLDDLGLVHMNGRIYDPLLGRFLSADLLVQNTGNLQAYNRYSYVMNNPLTLIDPTGFLNETAFGDQLAEDGTAGASFLGEMESQSAAGWTYKSFSDYNGPTGSINGTVGGVTDHDHNTVYIQDKGRESEIVNHAVHETGHEGQSSATTVGQYRSNEKGAFRKEAQYTIDAGRPDSDLTKREKNSQTGKKEYRVDDAAIDTRIDDAYDLKNANPNTKVAGTNLNDSKFSRVEVVNVRMIRLAYTASTAEAAAKQANAAARQAEKAAKKADPAHKAEAEAKAKEARSAADDAAAKAKAARQQAEEERKRLKKERGY